MTQTHEELTGLLRFINRAEGKILQQKWRVVTTRWPYGRVEKGDEIITENFEWRDVPLVQE